MDQHTRRPGAIGLAPSLAGRSFTGTAMARLGDCDPGGRLRLDGIARMLQDVASDDAADAGLDPRLGWVVRRTLIEVRRPAGLGERLTLTTFCSGTGRSWAERRTSVVGGRGAVVEAVSLWVQVDVVTGRPAPLDARFDAAYGGAAAGRRVSTRLVLPGPPASAAARSWPVRAVDLDVFGHANNAGQLAILEEVIPLADGRAGVAEIEYLAPLDPGAGAELVTVDGAKPGAWLVAATGVVTAGRWSPALPG